MLLFFQIKEYINSKTGEGLSSADTGHLREVPWASGAHQSGREVPRISIATVLECLKPSIRNVYREFRTGDWTVHSIEKPPISWRNCSQVSILASAGVLGH